jgi:hypothetical protein
MVENQFHWKQSAANRMSPAPITSRNAITGELCGDKPAVATANIPPDEPAMMFVNSGLLLCSGTRQRTSSASSNKKCRGCLQNMRDARYSEKCSPFIPIFAGALVKMILLNICSMKQIRE